MDTNELWASIENWRLWAVCGTALGLGAIGGAIQAISSLPDWATARKQLLARMLVGAVAAVAVIYVSDPKTELAFVGGALVAGYAGQAILGALEARAKLAIAKEVAATEVKLAIKTEEVKTATRERDTAVAAADLVIDGAPAALDGSPPPLVPIAALARIEAARGMLRAVRRPAADRLNA